MKLMPAAAGMAVMIAIQGCSGDADDPQSASPSNVRAPELTPDQQAMVDRLEEQRSEAVRKIQQAASDAALLEGFEVDVVDHFYSMGAGAINTRITNPLDVAIASIDVEFTARSPGRSVPWGTAELSRFIRGGAEPGETVDVQFQTGFSGIDLRSIPEDVEWAVQVIRVQGANGETILDARPLSILEQSLIDSVDHQ